MFLSFGKTNANVRLIPKDHLPRERAARRAEQEVDVKASRGSGCMEQSIMPRFLGAAGHSVENAPSHWMAPKVTALLRRELPPANSASPGIVNTLDLRRVARCSFGDLNRHTSPLPNGRSWCAKELDVATGAGNLYPRP